MTATDTGIFIDGQDDGQDDGHGDGRGARWAPGTQVLWRYRGNGARYRDRVHIARPVTVVRDDPGLLAWVHVTEVTSFLAAWRRYGEPRMSARDQDRYVDEMVRIAAPLGAAPIPTTLAEANRLIAATRPTLRVDVRTREVARLLLGQKPPKLAIAPLQVMTFRAAIDLLPGWARRMHGLADPPLVRPLLRAGTFGLAETVRWAFR